MKSYLRKEESKWRPEIITIVSETKKDLKEQKKNLMSRDDITDVKYFELKEIKLGSKK